MQHAVGTRLGQRSAPAWMSTLDRRSPMSVVSSSTSRLSVVDEVHPLPSPVDAPPSFHHAVALELPRLHTTGLEADKPS